MKHCCWRWLKPQVSIQRIENRVNESNGCMSGSESVLVNQFFELQTTFVHAAECASNILRHHRKKSVLQRLRGERDVKLQSNVSIVWAIIQNLLYTRIVP